MSDCKHCHASIEDCQKREWQSVVVNKNRINYRWDEDAKVFVVEFPRKPSQGATLEDGIAGLKSVVRIMAHLFETGEYPPEMRANKE